MKRRNFLKGATATSLATALPLLPRLCQANRNPRTEFGPPTKATETSKPVDCGRRNCTLGNDGPDCGGDCFLMTEEQITGACDTWFNFPGFSGETCSECNCQSFSCNNMPHEEPDLGPTRQTIRFGIHRSKTAAKQRQWCRDYEHSKRRRYLMNCLGQPRDTA